MKKLLRFVDEKLLKFGVAFAIFFTALYPKLPSVHIVHTWVYIRLEDFLIGTLALIWLIQVLRKKIKIPFAISPPFIFFWLVGMMSFLFSMVFIGPHIANYFPSVAFLNYFRRIEYMILFFIAISTVKSLKDIRDYLIILMVTVTGVVLYGFGQRWYISIWNLFPAFFEKFSFCFPSFQTGNEEFAKGIPLCLPPDARITSTFGGHYDLAGFLVLTTPVLFGIFLSFKNFWAKAYALILTTCAVILLILTASRISFIAFLVGISCMLIFAKSKKFIAPVVVISIALLLIFSASTAKRFLETIRIASVVTNSEGTVVGVSTDSLPQALQKKISKNPIIVENTENPQNLQAGSSFIALPGSSQKTNVAVVQSALTVEQQRLLRLQNGGLEISTISGTFLVQQALVYDISFTTRFQGEWPNAWNAFLRNPILGSGYGTITLATDSDYFRSLGETGILGFVSFALVFMYLGILLRAGRKSLVNPMAKYFAFALSGGVIGLLVNASFIDVFEASKIAEPLWILLGIGAGLMLFMHGEHKEKIHYFGYLKKIFTSPALIVIYLFSILGTVFFSSLSNFFTADDFTWLRWAASSSTIMDVIHYFTNAQGFFYRPLDKFIVFILFSLSAFKPEGYHLFTIIVHLLTTFGVYLFILAILKKKLPAFLGAVIFLVLPGHAENIYWFSTLSVSFSAMLLLFGVLFWISYRNSGKFINYLFSISLGILALFTYEGSTIFPLLLLITDFLIFGAKKNRKLLNEYIPFIITTIGYFILRLFVHSAGFNGDYSYSVYKFIPNLLGNIFGYSGMFLTGENIFSLYIPLRDSLKNYWIEVLAVSVVFLAVAFTFVFKKKDSVLKKFEDRNFLILIYPVLFAFISLLPFLGLGNISERYMYLASVGLVLFFIMILFSTVNLLLNKFNQKILNSVYIAVAVIFILFFTVSIKHEAKEWQKAGSITRSVLTILKADHEDVTPDQTIYFINLPIKYKNAWVYPVGLEDSIWFVYRESSPKIKLVDSVDQAKNLGQASGKQYYIYLLDKNYNIKEVK